MKLMLGIVGGLAPYLFFLLFIGGDREPPANERYVSMAHMWHSGVRPEINPLSLNPSQRHRAFAQFRWPEWYFFFTKKLPFILLLLFVAYTIGKTIKKRIQGTKHER